MRRETLEDNLAELQSLLDEMAPEVVAAFRKASESLVGHRPRLAEQVIARDPVLDDLRSRTELLAVETMNIHSPVTASLRSVISALHCAQHLERMGDLAAHIARTVVRHAPGPALPDAALEPFAGYGRLVAAMGDKAATVLRTRNVILAVELDADDDRVDATHRGVFELLFGEQWTDGIPAAVDAALLARFHERFADHTVEIAHQVVYAVTGRNPDQLSLAGGE